MTLLLLTLLYFVLLCKNIARRKSTSVFFKTVISCSLSHYLSFLYPAIFFNCFLFITENVKSRNLNSSLIITLCESFGNVAFNDTITIRFEYCHDWVKKKSFRQKNICIQTYHKINALHTSIKLFKITQAVFKHIIMYNFSHLQATLLISSSSFYPHTDYFTRCKKWFIRVFPPLTLSIFCRFYRIPFTTYMKNNITHVVQCDSMWSNCLTSYVLFKPQV